MPTFLDPENVSLANIAGGAAIERFDVELVKVLTDITDPNTDPKKKRKIMLIMEFSPSADRDHSGVSIKCKSDLAGAESYSSSIYIGKGADGKPIARQNHLKQRTFADLQRDEEQLTQDGNVTRLERKQG